MASVRPSIYIGIGGTGINAVAKTKKMFEDAYGKDTLPHLPVRFVCLDYDKTSATDPKNATDISDDFIKINNIANPRDLYRIQSENGRYKWFFPQNVQFMDDKVSNGAAQVRSYGRFLTEMIMNAVEAKLSTAYKNVKAIQQQLTDATAQIHTVDCHIVMSVAGGTGCGSFLNIAWALRQLFHGDVNIIGYGVLFGVFRSMDVYGNQTPRVVSNSYSAILDLDYLMSASPINPVTVSMNGKEGKLEEPLYNQFYVVDNTTENGKVVKDSNSLCEVISNCLFAAGGAIGDKVDSIMSNVHWRKGHQYNIQPKNGWAQSLGACQIIYNGEALADIYADKAAIEMIRQLVDSDSDVSQRAITWTETAKIREDGNEYNYLTDWIFSPEKINKIKQPNLDIKDSIEDTKSAVERYLQVVPEYPSSKQVTEIKTSIINALNTHTDGIVNSKRGIGNAKQFLESLHSLCVRYKSEMEHEKLEKDTAFKQAKENLDNRGFKDFEEINKRLLTKRSTKEEALDDLVKKPAQKLLRLKAESDRRSDAYTIFSELISVIENLQSRVSSLEEHLKTFAKDITNGLLSKQKASSGSSIFTLDLSSGERVNMPFVSDDVHLTDFIEAMPTSLLDENLSYSDLLEYICHFVRNEKVVGKTRDGKNKFESIDPAPFAQFATYKNKLIDEVIKELKESSPEKYENLKMEIDNYASRLLEINDRGMLTPQGKSPSQLLNKVRYICHYGQKDNMGDPIPITFQSDRQFTDDDNLAFLPIDSDYFKQRMIIYRSDFAVIPYCIKAFSDYIIESEYDTALAQSNSDDSDMPHPHFDKLLFDEMKKKDFKLKPELKNEAMFYWVCGNILDFGWKTTVENVNIMQKDSDGKPTKVDHKEDIEQKKYIRFYKGKYQYWNEGGQAIGGDKWVTINTADRKNAFDRFKSEILPTIKTQLNEKIKEQIRSNGIGFYEQRLQELTCDEKGEIKASYDYIDIFAPGNKNSATLYAGRTQEAAQYDEEWNYIVNELLNTLQNLR